MLSGYNSLMLTSLYFIKTGTVQDILSIVAMTHSKMKLNAVIRLAIYYNSLYMLEKKTKTE